MEEAYSDNAPFKLRWAVKLTKGEMKMYVKTIIYVILLLLVSSAGPSISSQSLTNSAQDQSRCNMLVALDRAIINYYLNHSELPEALDHNTLMVMGLNDLDIDTYSYQKISEHKYSLKANLSNNQHRESAYSNYELPLIEPESNIKKEN